jgi:hypothetical protein
MDVHFTHRNVKKKTRLSISLSRSNRINYYYSNKTMNSTLASTADSDKGIVNSNTAASPAPKLK